MGIVILSCKHFLQHLNIFGLLNNYRIIQKVLGKESNCSLIHSPMRKLCLQSGENGDCSLSSLTFQVGFDISSLQNVHVLTGTSTIWTRQVYHSCWKTTVGRRFVFAIVAQRILAA